MSEHAVHKRWDDFRARLSVGIRSSTFLMFPAAVGLFILATPIISTLLQHGITTEVSTDLVAAVLRFFVLGLLQFAVFQLLIRGFYAMQDARTPFLVNCVVVALNVAVNVPMFAWLRVKGLAAGQGIAYTVGMLVLARIMSRRLDGMEGARILSSTARIAAASAGMGAVVWAGAAVLDGPLGSTNALVQLAALTVVVGAGAGSYLTLARVLKVEELDYVRNLLRRRRSEPAPSESR